ncbi:MAG: GGDEF domain-containing protein [Terriglobia bacterium]
MRIDSLIDDMQEKVHQECPQWKLGANKMSSENDHAGSDSGTNPASPAALGGVKTSSEELERQIKSLDGRDFHLWSMGLLITLMVAAGFLALVLPNLMWGLGTLRVDGRYLPQLFFGFVAMIVLFNVYALDRKRSLRRTREELVRQLIRNQTVEMLSFLDPLTEIYNRRSLDEIIAREANRARRRGTPLTFAMIDVDRFKSVNTQFGHLVGDRVLYEIARMLKSTFRNSDYIIRYGGDEFLVVMTDTREDQAERAIERLQGEVQQWNTANSLPGYVMGLSCGLSSYQRGADVQKLIEIADSNMYVDKNCHMEFVNS